jgi:GT2 family glycosyltransferase
MTGDLSVIVVTHDSAAYIDPCLRSLIATEPHVSARTTPGSSVSGSVEIVVVDNRSQDGTADLVRASFPRVQLLIPPTRGGFARNVNLGLRAVHGRYVLVLNPDTEVQPDTLGRLAADLDQRPETGVVGPRLVSARGERQRSHRPFPTLGRACLESLLLDRLLPERNGGDTGSPFPVDWLAGACLLVRREVIEGDAAHPPVGLLDERIFLFGEDIEWCYRIRQAGWEVMVDPRLAILHHHGSGHGWDEWRYGMTCQGMIYFFRKHRGAAIAVLYQLILFPGLLLRAALAAAALVVGRPRRDEWRQRLRGYLRLSGRLATGALARAAQQ